MSFVRHSLAALVALLAVPVGACLLCLRPAWREGLRERLGLLPYASGHPIWVHAASAGEARAAAVLVRALREREGDLVLSTTTLTGRQLLRRQFPGLPVVLAPLDQLWCVNAALTRLRPRALVLIETELWPTWIAAATRRGLPVVLASGRISDRSSARSRALRWLLRPTVRRLSAIGARSEIDAERFVALGADRERVSVTGDLKFEAAEPVAASPDFEKVLGQRPLFVAGSTHEGEERAAEQAFAACRARGLQLDLLIAPRRPERATAVRELLTASGLRVRLRSELGSAPLEPGEVLLLDAVGELSALYAHATVAFVGGTLAELGGHNLLEPLQAGCPVLFGPHVGNTREAAELLLRSGAGIEVRDASELGRRVAQLMTDRSDAEARVLRGLDELGRHRGSAQRCRSLLESVSSAAEAAS